MRRAVAGAALVLLATTTAGCGGDPQEDYCSAVTEHQQELTETLGAGGPDALIRALPVFEDLRERAPRDIRDEWQQVVGAIGDLRDALEDADVDPATYDRDDPPAGVSGADRGHIDAAARELSSQQTVAAFNGLQQQARDVCQTPLSL